MMAPSPKTISRLGAACAVLSLGFLATAVASIGPDIEIAQRAIRFSQSTLTVSAGELVHYHNFDDVTHNLMVIGSDDVPQDQGLQRPGATVSYRFTASGTFEVRCAIHPKMKMTVTVRD